MAASKSRVERLEVDRECLENAIASCELHLLAGLVREHRMVLTELESLAAPQKGSTRDQLADRRKARKKSAARKPSSARTPSS